MRKRFVVSLLVIVVLTAVFILLLPLAIDVYSSLKAYNARIAKSYDYTEITTPLLEATTADVCAKFEISSDDKRCQEGAIVYGPDFFGDIASYFWRVPKKEATFELVQNKLGSYFVDCEDPNNEGHYRCYYDLRGDGIYPIFVYFDKEGFYYRIIANIGGS